MTGKQASIRIRLQPVARKDEICGWMADGTLKVRVKAKPIEGKANLNLINLLNRKLNIAAADIEIRTGAKSKNKLIVIRGLGQGELEERIRALMIQEP